MNHTNNTLQITQDVEDIQTKRWLLAPLMLAAIFIIIGIVGSALFANSANAQGANRVQFAPPDSSLIYLDYRNNWPNYISVSTDANINPDVQGIKNISLSVHNQTDKFLDEVKVKVDYITSSGKSYKSEMVTLNNIAPHSAKSANAPDSDKGICVKMQIESIHAAAFHFCYSHAMKTGNSVDPYLCN